MWQLKEKETELQQRLAMVENIESERDHLASQEKAIEALVDEVQERSKQLDVREGQLQFLEEKVASDRHHIEVQRTELKKIEEREEGLSKRAQELEAEVTVA